MSIKFGKIIIEIPNVMYDQSEKGSFVKKEGDHILNKDGTPKKLKGKPSIQLRLVDIKEPRIIDNGLIDIVKEKTTIKKRKVVDKHYEKEVNKYLEKGKTKIVASSNTIVGNLKIHLAKKKLKELKDK